MGYKKSPFKMATKSPLAKALKGNQGKLPQQLQDAIKAAPESPAKQVKLGNAFGNTKSKLMNEHEGRLRSDAKRGDKEAMQKLSARDKIKFNAKQSASLKGQAYTAREDNFGVKKPKASIKSPAKNYKNGYYGK